MGAPQANRILCSKPRQPQTPLRQIAVFRLSCSIAKSYTRPGFRRTVSLLQQYSVNREISLIFGGRPLTSYPGFRPMPVQDWLPANVTHYSENEMVRRIHKSVMYTQDCRILRLGLPCRQSFILYSGAHELPLPVTSVIAGFLRHSRRGVFLAFRAAIGLPDRPRFWILSTQWLPIVTPRSPVPFAAKLTATPPAVDGFRLLRSPHGEWTGLASGYPHDARTGPAGCLEAWVGFVHRVGRVYDFTMELSFVPSAFSFQQKR